MLKTNLSDRDGKMSGTTSLNDVTLLAEEVNDFVTKLLKAKAK